MSSICRGTAFGRWFVMFEWRDSSDDETDEKPVQQTQAQGDLVLFEGERIDEAQVNGRWMKGDSVERKQ